MYPSQSSEYQRARYAADPEKFRRLKRESLARPDVRARALARNAEYQRMHATEMRTYHKLRAGLIRAVINFWKSEHPCVDCGEDNPIVLQFDHRDPKAKSFNLSHAPRLGVSFETLMAEIAKCDLRCANCHTIRTSHQRHWVANRAE